jgi:hypothetical protein
MVLSFIPKQLAALGLSTPGHSGANFKYIYLNKGLRDDFHAFLKNVYSIYPDQQMHDLIYELAQSQATDEEVYRELQRKLPEITPFLNIVTHSLPALAKQKKEMAQQAQQLLASMPKVMGIWKLALQADTRMASKKRFISPGLVIFLTVRRLRLRRKIWLTVGKLPSQAIISA